MRSLRKSAELLLPRFLALSLLGGRDDVTSEPLSMAYCRLKNDPPVDGGPGDAGRRGQFDSQKRIAE